jgi:hypothetical protein
MPKRRSKHYPLTKQDKAMNREISSQRVPVENVLAHLKRFKIIADRYRNRRKRFALRFNLISAIYNMEVKYEEVVKEVYLCTDGNPAYECYKLVETHIKSKSETCLVESFNCETCSRG